jgi:hypothetical protein
MSHLYNVLIKTEDLTLIENFSFGCSLPKWNYLHRILPHQIKNLFFPSTGMCVIFPIVSPLSNPPRIVSLSVCIYVFLPMSQFKKISQTEEGGEEAPPKDEQSDYKLLSLF